LQLTHRECGSAQPTLNGVGTPLLTFFRLGASQPLQARRSKAPQQGFRRLRVGPYRVVCAFDGTELLISVIRVRHRREVYR